MSKQKSSVPVADRKTLPAPKPRRKHLPLYHILLMNDDEHTYDYVIEMLEKLFGHPRIRAFRLAQEVDLMGRSIVFTTHRELAELKRDQIQAYGTDPRSTSCAGSMTAKVEPAT